MLKSGVSESHDDKTKFLECAFGLKVLDPVQKVLPIVRGIAVAISWQEHDNGALKVEEIFNTDVTYIHDRGGESDFLDNGLELIGILFGHAWGSGVINR